METDKQTKRRKVLRTMSWFVVVLQVTAVSWLLISLGVDKFTSMVWAVLFSAFTVIGMLLKREVQKIYKFTKPDVIYPTFFIMTI